MVYNGTDYLYYLKYYEDVKDGFNEKDMVDFLENILSGNERVSLLTMNIFNHLILTHW